MRHWPNPIFSLVFAAAFMGSIEAGRPAAKEAPKEQDLIATISSKAPGEEKALACKKLAIYGSEAAVPALAPLLKDPQLASWARIALEAIPGAAADQALREALPQLSGRLLVGTINSIGVRRDQKACELLAAKLSDGDPEVVSAAAVALGRIGGDRAAAALRAALAKAPSPSAGLAEGCIRCAEQYLASGKTSAAMKLYDRVRASNPPKQQMLDATRGAILARKSKGIPLLVQQLESTDKDLLAIGLSTARELPGPEATTALAKQVQKATPERQPLLLLALADRNDPEAMPTILECAGSSSKPLRLTAVRVLDRIGTVSCVPALEKAAASDDSELSQAGIAALTRLQGAEIDSKLGQDLAQASGRDRCVLLEVAGRRGLESALPAVLASAGDPDAHVRAAAFQAMGAMGGTAQISDLSKLLKQAKSPQDREGIEQALLAICSRGGASCVSGVQALAQDSDSANRMTALHLLAASGGSEALSAIKAATTDKDESVQDEAVRTLSSWPNTWPEDESVVEPLLSVAKSSTKTSHQVLALRGYLQFFQGDKKINQEEKVSKVAEVIPLLQRPEEKRLAIAVVRPIHSNSALTLLVSLVQDPAVADDACSALLDLSKSKTGIAKEQRQQALQAVIDKCANDDLKKRAEEALKNL